MNRTTVFVVILILAGLAAWRFRDRVPRAARETAQSVASDAPSQKVASPGRTKDGTPSDKTMPGATPEVSKAINSFDTCTDRNAIVRLNIKKANRLAMGRKVLAWYPEENSPCVAVGKAYTVEGAIVDDKTGDLYFAKTIGTAKVGDLRIIDFSNHDSESQQRARKELGSNYEKARWAALRESKSKRIVAFRLQLEAGALDGDSSSTPRVHPKARLVSRDEAQKLSQANAIFIDVRPEEQFKLDTIPKSVNFASPSYEKLAKGPIAPQLFLQKSGISTKQISKSVGRPLVVFGNAEWDHSSYNLVSYLVWSGYKDVSWYRGGYEDWKGLSAETPREVPGVTVIGVGQLKQVMPSRPTVLDLRTTAAFRSRRIKGSFNVRFAQAQDQRQAPLLRPAPFSPSSLGGVDKGFGPNGIPPVLTDKDKNAPVVVYGRNEFDWLAPKAAYSIATSGFKRVYWLRSGWPALLKAAKADPAAFRLYAARSKNKAKSSLNQSTLSKPRPAAGSQTEAPRQLLDRENPASK